MKFLVIANPRDPVPPDKRIPMVDAMLAWIDAHTKKGQAVQVWSNAGRGGGGAIVEVGSLEQLDELMSGYPFGNYQNVEIHPIVDMAESMQRRKADMQTRAKG